MQPVVIGDVIWEPSPEVIERSRLKRFMDRHGIETFDELQGLDIPAPVLQKVLVGNGQRLLGIA